MAKFYLGLAIGVVIGAVIGIMLISLLISAKQADNDLTAHK